MNEKETPGQPVILWDCEEDAEVLHHTTKKDAIESYLDANGQLKGKVIVYGYARMVVPKPDESEAARLVEGYFDCLDEAYISEDGPDITDRMKEAALVFLNVLYEEFIPHACEQVTLEEIDVADWVAENCPHWLKEKT